jgi:hypothetical protein
MKTRNCELLFTISFLTILFAMPVSQAVLELAQGQRPQVLDVLTRAPTEKNLRAFESDLEDTSWAVQAVRPHLRQLHFSALRDPVSTVLRGCDGWLFYKAGVDYLVQSNEQDSTRDLGSTAAIAAIVDFRDQLQRRGIQLLVVPVPGKASVYPDRLTQRVARGDSSLRSPTADVIDSLRRKGVATIDLFSVFRSYRETVSEEADESIYLAHDTHWSPRGVRVAAETIADHIQQARWVMVGDVAYEREAVEIRRAGDIVRMMHLADDQQVYLSEKTLCQQIVQQNDSLVYRDDSHSPVLLLGDSFSRIYQRDEPLAAGLVAQLAYEMKMPLSSIVNDGGASTLVRQQLARRPELLKGKKLVIWQFVERDIRFGTEGWKVVAIPGDANDM